METTAALTKNAFLSKGTIRPLDKDIHALQDDYEIMKKNREQAKADLQAKFDEVESKLAECKANFKEQAVKINKSIQGFQKKFAEEITNMESQQTTQHKSFVVVNDKRLVNLHDGIVKLDEGIEKEKQDRIRTEAENIRNIQKLIDQLFANFELEKQTRIQNEKANLTKIQETSIQIHNQIQQEMQERNTKFNELKTNTGHTLGSQERYGKGFEVQTIKEFNDQITSIEGEMDNRFLQQDQVVDDFRKVISTIQNTLTILGKDV